jgi:hypothetical protein
MVPSSPEHGISTRAALSTANLAQTAILAPNLNRILRQKIAPTPQLSANERRQSRRQVEYSRKDSFAADSL